MDHRRSLLMFVALVSASLLSVSAILECGDLPVDFCAFSVSSTAARCVLEKKVMREGDIEYECQTSIVTAVEFIEWVETDDCVRSCGLERMSVGMSSDSLVENGFAKSLCSAECQDNCPNIVELYTKLAAGEGVILPQLCDAQRSDSRRALSESMFASASKYRIDGWKAYAEIPLSTASPPLPAKA